MNKPGVRRIAIKVGSNVLADTNGLLDLNRLQEIVRQISILKKQGVEVILISSGAVASGRSLIESQVKLDAVGQRQLWAALGQVKLIQSYSSIFQEFDLLCSQVLVTREDFRSRQHYLNIKNCFSVLLSNNIIPIVNENDVVSITELMFTDNDELAGLVATMLNVDNLIVLTTVDGVMNDEEGGKVIESIMPEDKSFEKFIKIGKSSFGRGGMITKVHMAQKVAEAGIRVHIANGANDNSIIDILDNNLRHTIFYPAESKSNIKKWLSHAQGFEKGAIVINEGAANRLLSGKAASLLPVGIVEVNGIFEKGDVIEIKDIEHNRIGLGIAQYNHKKAGEKMGQRNQRPLIHYDYLFLT